MIHFTENRCRMKKEQDRAGRSRDPGMKQRLVSTSVKLSSHTSLLIALSTSVVLAFLIPWPHPYRVASCSLAVWETPHETIAYLYALRLEDEWTAARPQSKSDLERHLHLYSKRIIAPTSSCWGHRYSLAQGEVMVQYLLL